MPNPVSLAQPTVFDEIWQFYADVCEGSKYDRYGPSWTLGVYPSEEDIRNHLNAQEFYLVREEGRLLAAMVLVAHEDPEYEGFAWPSGAAGEQVAVIHLLAVHPAARGQGLGAWLVQEAVRLARAEQKAALHLDVVPGNLAASRIYLQQGFSFVGHHQVFYEDLGKVALEMYELVL